MSLHVGQKVVCVDDSHIPTTDLAYTNRPSKGQVYTIRGFSDSPQKGEAGIYLEEVVNPVVFFSRYDWSGEGSFRVRRFRPVQTRSTESGMSILRKVADEAAKKRNLTIPLGAR